jgi:hypothetical protein
MYQVNPAVIKNRLLSLSSKELIQEIKFMHSQLEVLPPGNKRFMFEGLKCFAFKQFWKLKNG